MRVVKIISKFVLQNSENRERGDDIYHVTDLCRCPLKRIYEQKYPHLIKPFAPPLVTGQIVHLGLQQLLGSEGFEIEVEKRKDLKNYTIIGKIDALNEEEGLGVEIKFSKDDKFIPYEHHILQAKINETLLVYVTPERITEFEVDEKPSTNLIEQLILNDKAPKYDWECRYCEFSVICPNKRC